MNKISRFIVWICKKFNREQIEKIIQGLLEILEPYKYLLYLFENLPHAKTRQDYKKLLPQYLDRDKLIQK